MAKKTYKIQETRFRLYGDSKSKVYEGTLDELIEIFSYTLECGRSWEHEKGNKKINVHPATAKSLVSNLNKAAQNTGRSFQSYYYDLLDA